MNKFTHHTQAPLSSIVDNIYASDFEFIQKIQTKYSTLPPSMYSECVQLTVFSQSGIWKYEIQYVLYKFATNVYIFFW